MAKGYDNFTRDDLVALEAAKDVDVAIELGLGILAKCRPGNTTHPMAPQKIVFIERRINNANRASQVVGIFYNMLLSGEGLGALASNGSANSYQKLMGSTKI